MTPGAAGGGGKTNGSNVMVVATPSPFAVVIAALKLPEPESARLLTISCAKAHDAARRIDKVANKLLRNRVVMIPPFSFAAIFATQI
jgi:hypothetical protein